jgi:hypothetical protein
MKISYTQVESYCNELHNLAKNMNELIENVNIISDSIIKSGNWEGVAADYYVNKLNRVTKNFDDVFCEMENSILYMAKCAEGYNAIDKDVVREICSNLKISSPSLNTSSIFN